MTTQTEALKLALEALENLINQHYAETTTNDDLEKADNAITAIKAALEAHKALMSVSDGAQPEQPKQNTVEAVKAVLKGIDQTEIESPDGWWETSTGAEFGAKKLKYVVGLLAQPEHEPVAVLFEDGSIVKYEDLEFVPEKSGQRVQMLYTTPPYVPTERQRKPWVGLTDEERGHVYASLRFNGSNSSNLELCRAIEAKLKAKNERKEKNT